MTRGLRERIRLSQEVVERALDKAENVDSELEARLNQAVDEAKIDSRTNQAIGVKAPTDIGTLSGVFYSDLKHVDELPPDFFQGQAEALRDADGVEQALKVWKRAMDVANVLPGHNKELYTDDPENVVNDNPERLVEDLKKVQEHYEHVVDEYEEEIQALDESLQEREALVKELNQAKSIIEDNIGMLKSVRDRYVLHDVSVQGIQGETVGDLVDEIHDHLVNVRRLAKTDIEDKSDKVAEQVDVLGQKLRACRQILGSLANLIQKYPTQTIEEIISELREQAQILIEQSKRESQKTNDF